MSDAEAVLASMGAASKGAKVEPLNLKTEFEKREDEEDVYRIVSIPLWGWVQAPPGEEDPRTPYRVGATAWDDYVQNRETNAIIYFLQLMMLLVEYSELMGGPICTADPHSNPNKYQEICKITARLLRGSKPHPTAEQIREKGFYVVQNDKADLRFAYDVEWEKRVLDHEARMKRRTAGEKKKAAERAARRNRPEKTQDQRDVEWFAELGIEYFHYGVEGDVERRVDIPPYQAEGEEEEEQEDEKLPPKVPYEGPGQVRKVSMTITEIPHRNDPNEIMGLMVNFIIRDKHIDPGYFFMRVCENLKLRNRRIASRGAGGHVSKQYDFPEMFPEYEHLMLSRHPVGKYSTYDLYARCVQTLYPDFVQKHHRGNRNHFLDTLNPGADTPAHLYRVLSPEFAIQCLLKAGGCPEVLRAADAWIDRDRGVLHFPQRVRTWKPAQNHVVWDDPKTIGFVRQFFPHVDMRADFLRSLCSGADMQAFLSGASEEAVAAHGRLEKVLAENIRIFNEDLEDFRKLGYDTTNELVYKWKQCEDVYRCINQHYPSRHAVQTLKEVQELTKLYSVRWRQYLTAEQHQRVEEYELYANIINTAQATLLVQFNALINLDRDAEGMPISGPMRAIVKWYQDVHATKLPHMTREYATIDPTLDPFGNTMLRQLYIYTHYAKILQPMICLLSEGLFSCYDAFIDELSYHQMIHGRYEIGKTWTGIRTLVKFSTIPGTVSEYSLATKASDTTARHAYDEIVATDECPEWLVNENEAKKNPELVNKEKVKLTRGQLTQRTFKFVDTPGGRKVRWAEDVTTDHKKACIYISNGTAESKRALSSRMHRLIMKQCDILPNDLSGPMGETAMKDAQMFLHINQFLSAMAKKMAMVGGILPDVELSLYNDVSSRVIKYLREQNAVPEDVGGSRSLEIIKSYLRQLVYKMAIRYTFDFPWSKHYQKKFHPDMLRDIQPFLYVTTPMIYWVWTACAAEWINDDYCNVLNALLKEAGVEWENGDTPYSLFEHDTENRIKFRTFEDRFFNSSTGEQSDRHLVDLNYLVLEGTEDGIAQRIAHHTSPKMEADQIKGVLKRLSEMQKVPHLGGYRPVRKGALETWHRFKADGTKETGNGCPHEFMHNNPNFAMYRTEDDMPRLVQGATLPIVDRSDLAKRKLYFMPGFAASFRQEIILDALIYATTCASTRPGKMLLGFTNRENPGRLETHRCSDVDIQDLVMRFDADEGFEWNDEGEWVNDDPHIISRRHGITFNRAGALSDMDKIVEMAVPLAPKPVGDDSWRTKYEADAEAMSKDQDLVYDLDYESAARQHARCGRPLDEPVRSPQWIADQCAKHSIPNMGLDYPQDEIRMRGEMEKKWRKSVRVTHRTASILEEFRNRGKMSAAESEAFAARRREEMQRQQHQAKRAMVAAPQAQQPQQKRMTVQQRMQRTGDN